MNFLVGVWIIYLLGSFLFSVFAPRIRNQQHKNFQDSEIDNHESVEKPITKPTNKEQLQRKSDIRARNERVQAMRKRHNNQSDNPKLVKNMSLNQLNNSLKKANNALGNTKASPGQSFESQDDYQVDFTKIADYDNPIDHSYMEGESPEQYLYELENWYADASIEDVSWMELDNTNILQDEHTQKAARPKNKTVNHMYHSMRDGAKLREMMIFNEIINRPKSLRNK